MTLKSRTPNSRYNALRYGAALLTLPLFLAACGGTNTAASNTSSPSTASASATASTTPTVSCSSYSTEDLASAEATKPVPRTDEQYPAYIQYRNILADGAHIIEPSELDSNCHAALKAGRSALPEYVQSIDVYNARPSVGLTDPFAGSEYRDIKNRNEFIPHRADLEEAGYPEVIIRLYEKWYEAAPADIKTLSDGNRARFLATSAYQQWKTQPQTPSSARP
ncbi:hypothetical protein [uncultured Rothia sp.]|uniref:hypothetical protein n=1 Tax=uncultured Rothia sp. TaxID=316088 RepID=UPI002889F908|nr:hypothetical protein [uncultured Rothia sp.]